MTPAPTAPPLVTTLEALTGKTIDRAVELGMSDNIALQFSDGSLAVFYGLAHCDGGAEVRLHDATYQLDNRSLVTLGVIDEAEYQRRIAESNRKIQEATVATELAQYEALKRKYGP